jgi:DNA-binding response OmpR family regulator
MNIACYFRTDAYFEQLREALVRAGFVCERFINENLLLRTVRRRSFEFILIDIGSEMRDSENIFSWLGCRTGDSTPVLVLCDVRNAEWVADALDSGADDFVVSPFEPIELVARIHAILRRSNRHQARRIIELAGFSLDRETGKFSYESVPIVVTPREFTMAWLLFSSPGVYVSRETISTAIWGMNSQVAGRTIEQHVYKLRKKLRLGSDREVIIRTAYNQGYRLELSKPENTASGAKMHPSGA